MALEGTVKVPGVGPVKKQYVYVGGAAVAGIVVYVWWSGRQGSAGAAGTAEAPAEELGEAALEDGTGVPGTDYVPPVVQTPPPVVSDPAVITNNAQWAQAAVAALTDVGADTLAASAAIGRYLAGMGLSAAAADLVRQAVALVGEPPTGDHPIKLEPVTTPNPTLPSGSTLAGPAGLKTTAQTKTTVTLSWSPVAGAEYYRVYRKGAGTNIGSSEDTQHVVSGLKANTSYTFQVRAVGHDGKYGKPSNQVTVKTKK
ncbi:fibronectin type III domain-containing protein [Planomonospora sp. ID82291]|uniref:fibronectin type III domain-containing protein n=1 Tax=Planomonospora sp. ID82291 TaxID=2738136 RepID=UPI001E50CA53|nr:fibronectin type III domain-containing protein [Planomonospora sp. ID82291]